MNEKQQKRKKNYHQEKKIDKYPAKGFFPLSVKVSVGEVSTLI